MAKARYETIEYIVKYAEGKQKVFQDERKALKFANEKSLDGSRLYRIQKLRIDDILLYEDYGDY